MVANKDGAGVEHTTVIRGNTIDRLHNPHFHTMLSLGVFDNSLTPLADTLCPHSKAGRHNLHKWPEIKRLMP